MGTQPQIARWPLAGRDDELEAFASAWADRRCRGVVICGPAGVGKSRLAEECLARAVHEGWMGRRAAASAAAAVVPLGAIAHLIPAGVDFADPVRGFRAVATELAGPQRDRHWAIWVDDLHLLDATSAVLLRQLTDARVVRLIGTIRTGDPVSDAVEALTGGDAVHRIDLTVFEQQLTRVVLEAALGGSVARHTVYELHTASGGNALYLRELVLGALASGELASDGEIWELAGHRLSGTPMLAELIATRLAAADPSARPVLELLALAEPLPLADAGQAVPIDLLTDLERTGLVQIVMGRRRTTLQLAHPLYGEVLRADIPDGRRRALLLELAERTQTYGAQRHDDALRIATWQLAAIGTTDPTLLVQAASLARHAYDFEQVITLLDALPNRYRTTMTRLFRGSALQELGRSDEAQAALAEAETHATAEPEKLAAVFTRALTLTWAAAKPDEALAVTQAARATLTSPIGQRMLRVYEGWIRILRGELPRGLTLLADLEQDAEEAPDANGWLMGAVAKSAALALSGRTAEATTWAEIAYTGHAKIAKQTMGPHPAATLTALILAYTEAGNLNKALQIGEDAYTTLLEIRASVPRVWTALNLARGQWQAGHPVTARYWYAEAAALARAHHQMSALRVAFAGLAASAALIADTETAQAMLKERDSYPRMGLYGMGLYGHEEKLADAWLLAVRGQRVRARAVLTEAARAARESGHVTTEMLLLTDVARLGDAGAVRNRLAELARRCGSPLAKARAAFASALATEDPDQLTASANELEAIGADLLAAEAATTAAAAWHRSDHARKAAAATQQAQACAARCQGARTPLMTAAQTATALSTREKEVALLAAAGTASKDIAGTLHLSVRTVDNHLQHAYAKLGVTTRGELADTLGITGRPATDHGK